MNLGEPDVLCDCGGTFYTPTKVREEIERARQDAYAEGRKDERAQMLEELRAARERLEAAIARMAPL